MNLGSYTSIDDAGEVKDCKASCEGETYQATTSASLFPVPGTFSLSPMFCHVVENIENACHDQAKEILEVFYPQICQLVEMVQKSDACNPNYRPSMIKGWGKEKDDEFSNLIFRYTRENIVVIDIYMKDPFAVKFLIDENAPR